MIFRILIISCLIYFSCVVNVYAQENIKSAQETQLEQKAFTFFKAENYSQALPLFSQLLSLYPKEPNYNYGYAVCLIETNQQIEKAIKYLQFADSKSDNPLIKFYLGRAYHLSYKFDEALGFYALYSKKATTADKKKYLLDSRIAMCNNGKELIRYISDLTVVDNKKIKSEDYYYSYELKDFGGKLIIKPPEFKSKIDKKLETPNTVIFLPNQGNEIYYGSYGDNKSNGRDIFKIKKNPYGKWGVPVNLGTVINTPYDEDFAFLHSDGKTLFFSSKGHNSMGGYDIFKSEYDSITNKWLKPENLDFPINTPYDDYLYIPDKNEKYAFFASNRETTGDKISVYKIIVDKKPIKREFNNIEEVINTSKLEVSTLAEINKSENANADNSNKQILSQNNTNIRSTGNFKFKPITYSANLTTQQLNSEIAGDEKIVNEQADDIRKQSDLAYLSASEKNNEANEKRKLASDKTNELYNTTDQNLAEKKKQEIFELITDAENLEKDAVTACNLAKNLNQIATDIKKDAVKTKNIKEAINNTNNSNNESLVEVINKNKERLNISQNKYTTIENEIENRTSQANSKQMEFLQYEREYKANQNDISSLEDEIGTIKQQIDNETDNSKKAGLANQLAIKNNQLDNYRSKDSILEENYGKAKIESENIQSEVSFLKDLHNNISADTRSLQDIATLTKNINKEQLHKDIFEKELTADVKNANAVLQNKVQTNNLTAQNNIVKNTNIKTNNIQEVKNNTNIQTPQNNTETNNAEVIKKLYSQAEGNSKIADSIKNVIAEKENIMATITDTQKHADAFNEISELNKLMEVKRQQSNQQLKQAKEMDKTLASKANIYNNNSVFPFNSDNTTNRDSKLVAYQKELLNAQYYDNLVKEQKSQLDILQNTSKYTNDAETKLFVEKQITDLNKKIEHNSQVAAQSNTNAQKLHPEAVSEVDTNITNEQLVLNATQYQIKSPMDIGNEQKQTIKLVAGNRENIKEIQKNLNNVTTEINDLNKKRETADIKTQKQIDKELVTKRENQKKLLTEFVTATKKSNQDESAIYKDVIDANKKIDISNPDIRLANMLDKEAEIYFEKAANVRKDAELREKPEEIVLEYQKADNIEQIAIQKQKYSIDLFLKSQTGLTANNTYPNKNNNLTISPDTNLVPRTVEITLNPDEEEQLKTFRQGSHKAEVLLAESNKNLADVETKRNLATSTFSAKEKQRILKGIDAKEQKALDQSLIAYKDYGKADSLKYMVYQNQIKQLQSSTPDLGNNKLIAKQYTNEAEFYFNEAAHIRQKSVNITNKNQKAGKLKQATEFEKKALASQEFAVDVLTNVNPVFFVSTNDLTRVDRLDVLNQPVDVNDIIHIKTTRIVSKLNLTETELKRLDEVEKKRVISNQLMVDADKYEATIDSLQKIVSNSAKEKNRKKAREQIPKLEKKMFASQFTSIELDETVNDTRFYLYNEYFKKNRLNDNTTEARQGKQLEKDAISKYSKAKSLREKAFMKVDAHKAFELDTIAKKLEEEAIEDQEKAFGIYLKLKPLDDEIKEYALNHPAKNNNANKNLIVKTNVDITPIETKIDTTEQMLVSNTNENNIENNEVKNVNVNPVNNQNNETNNIIENNNNAPVDTVTKSNVIVNNISDIVDTISNFNKKNVEENYTITKNKTENINVSNVNTNNLSISDALNKEGFGFSILPVNAYSNASPIPMNAPMPEGIVFKVQIGAFKAPIKNESFKGLSPVTGEALAGSQYVRYFVGLFYSEEAATIVRDQIRPIGYYDAFLAAFKDGKRIPLYEARRLLKEKVQSEEYKLLSQAEVDKVKNRTLNAANQNINKQLVYNKNATNIPVNSTNVTKTSGLFYTVQIGVYKNPVTAGDLKNLSPIYEEQIYGFIRYTTGKYADFKKANLEKNRIVQLGITDAFVSAYYNGKRLTTGEASIIEKQNPGAYTEQIEVKYPEQEIDVNQNTNLPMNKDSVVFKVQIGSFKEKVPVNKVNRFLELASNHDVEQERDATGIIAYFVGKFQSYNEAIKMRDILINEGANDAFIVAFNGKQKIPVNYAKKLLNQ